MMKSWLESIDTANNSLQCIDKFCFLGDIIDAGDEAESSSVARLRSGWEKDEGG